MAAEHYFITDGDTITAIHMNKVRMTRTGDINGKYSIIFIFDTSDESVTVSWDSKEIRDAELLKIYGMKTTKRKPRAKQHAE